MTDADRRVSGLHGLACLLATLLGLQVAACVAHPAPEPGPDGQYCPPVERDYVAEPAWTAWLRSTVGLTKGKPSALARAFTATLRLPLEGGGQEGASPPPAWSGVDDQGDETILVVEPQTVTARWRPPRCVIRDGLERPVCVHVRDILRQAQAQGWQITDPAESLLKLPTDVNRTLVISRKVDSPAGDVCLKTIHFYLRTDLQ